MYCVAKINNVISCAVHAQRIKVFVFAHANNRVSNGSRLMLKTLVMGVVWTCSLTFYINYVMILDNRGIKHDFPFINIRKVPREVFKTEGEVQFNSRLHLVVIK